MTTGGPMIKRWDFEIGSIKRKSQPFREKDSLPSFRGGLYGVFPVAEEISKTMMESEIPHGLISLLEL